MHSKYEGLLAEIKQLESMHANCSKGVIVTNIKAHTTKASKNSLAVISQCWIDSVTEIGGRCVLN